MTATQCGAPEDWHATVAEAVAAGWGWLDHLSTVDRGSSIEVVLALRSAVTGECRLLTTTAPVPNPVVACICDLLPGAAWHEREAAEMTGVAFFGHEPMEPLLVRGEGRAAAATLLLRSTPLRARLEVPWPGAEGAKRQRVPGINPEWEQQ